MENQVENDVVRPTAETQAALASDAWRPTSVPSTETRSDSRTNSATNNLPAVELVQQSGAPSRGSENERPSDKPSRTAPRAEGQTVPDGRSPEPSGPPDRPPQNSERGTEKPNAKPTERSDRPSQNSERGTEKPNASTPERPDRPSQNSERGTEKPNASTPERPDRPPQNSERGTEKPNAKPTEQLNPGERNTFGERNDTVLDAQGRPTRIGGTDITWNGNNNISSIDLGDGLRFEHDPRGFLIGTRNGQAVDGMLLPNGSIEVDRHGVNIVEGNGRTRLSLGIPEASNSPAWARMVQIHNLRRNGER